MSTITRLILVLLLTLTGAAAGVGTASAAPCPGAGSAPSVAGEMTPTPVVATRVGRHDCYDRVVFRIAGSAGAGWDVRYVDVVTQDGSGEPLDVPGGARLAVVLRHPAHDEQGQATYPFPIGPVADVAGYDTLRSVVFGGSFEGMTTFGVGVRARLPFRVFELPGPGGDTRIVVDVLHTWTSAR